VTPQNASGTFILSREDTFIPLVERECSWRVLEAPTAGRSGCNPGQAHASPGQLVFLPGEGNGKNKGKPRISRTIHPPALDVAAAAVLVPGAAPKERAPCAVGQGGSEVDAGWPGLRLFGSGFTPRESGYLDTGRESQHEAGHRRAQV
jgi:hypothetical protein